MAATSHGGGLLYINRRFIGVKAILLLMVCCCFIRKAVCQKVYHLSSPDGSYDFNCYQKSSIDSGRVLYYTLDYKGVRIISPSRLDLTLDNHLSEQAMALKVDSAISWFGDMSVKAVIDQETDTSWVPVHGEKSRIRDHYRAITIEMVKDSNPIYTMNLEVRAYDQGVAFRFFFPLNEKGTYYRIMQENDEFALPEGTKAWFAGWAQAPYSLLDLKNWPQESERPLTLQFPNGWYGCLAEAQMTDYARTKFKLSKTKPGTLETSMYTPADQNYQWPPLWHLN